MQRKIKGLFIYMMLLCSLGAAADEIRYVSKSGTYSNDGKSWSTAKANIQDAINDLVDNGLTGEVWVAAGTYTPTESTESTGGSTVYMSFKIPAGISVYGGFAGTETSKDQRVMNTSKPIGQIYANETVLSGDLSSAAEFTWNTTKDQWDVSFYGNCYHVVFFATKGFDATTGRAKPNGGAPKSAMLEGCIIEHGNAVNSDIAGRPHNAYGGGVYMVEGSCLKNCLVRQCSASRDGGGIYMDGGGYVEHTGVTDCQSLGIGTSYGYGGGVCMDGPDTYTENHSSMIFRRSGVFGCVGRMGGGVSMTANDTIGNNKYKLACVSVVVANNTATIEAGGIYMNRGGAITQTTVVNNKCNGAGVIVNGMTNGRAAGIYCRDNAVIANSVLWGGKCAANNDIQFASSRSGNSTSLNPYMMYTSLTQSDYTDWSGVIKRKVTKLTDYNDKNQGTANASEGYPMFSNPSPNAGYVSSAQAHQFLYGGVSSISSGVTLYDTTGAAVSAADIKPGVTYYKDATQSTAAVEGKDYVYLGAPYDFQPLSRSSLNHQGVLTVDIDRYGQTPAYEVDWDIIGKRYTPRPSLGAYTSVTNEITPETTSDTEGNTVVNFYVDPNDDGGTEYAAIGSSWDQPARFFSDVIAAAAKNNYPTTTKVNIYVKQGTVSTINTSAFGRVRNIPIAIPSNMNIYGGYPSANTGTSLDGRNPNRYVTIISANVQDDYDLNVAHLLSFDGTENTVLDGFSIRYANARGTEMLEGTPVTTGAAMTFNGAKNVKILNSGIANNTASQGAAADMVDSEVYFENCIFHNNESRVVDADGNVTATTGNILVRKGSSAVFCHCDFLRNVGNAIDSYGEVKVVNSVFYGNMREPLDDTRGNEDKALVAVRLLEGGTFTGNHNLYDSKSVDFIANNSLDDTNETILTYTYSDTSTTYPRFINPTKNAGVSTTGDVTYYGRTISFQPHNNNPMVNRAATVGSDGTETTDHTKWGIDMTGIVTRDYGGLPDIGAVENHQSTVADEGEKAYPNGQPPYGGALYVRDYRDSSGNVDTSTTGRDGSSWSKAINGNGTYGSVKGLQYALNLGNTEWNNDQTTLREVRVGAGTYTANLEWKEGVNVRGGYPAVGNPGEDERNISNAVDGYKTIIDANNSGRGLKQNTDFSVAATFEGFTIQNGASSGSNFGAGVYLLSNGILKNCLVQNNVFTAQQNQSLRNQGGGGICMSTGSVVKNCKVMKNKVNCNNVYSTSPSSYRIYVGGAGVYALGGTLINSLIVENTAYNNGDPMLGAGFYISKTSSLYNCTIAYNVGQASSSLPATGGIWDAPASYNGTTKKYTGQSNFYNCIIWGNYATGNTSENMIQVGMSGFSNGAGSTNDAFHSCYSSAWSKKYASDDVTNSDYVTIVGDGTEGSKNNYQAFYNNCKNNEPFVRDANGDTDYSLKSTATQCINKGSTYQALTDYDITVDINGEDRVQDCTIDKGAYEYNQSLDITPEIIAATGAKNRKMVFYVTPEGRGTASADSPTNAACASKLQKVLDAAGRYKYNSPADTVIVKVANSDALAAAGSDFQYYACRTTDEGDQSVRVWSIIVPRGVEVWGGYNDTYTSADDNGFYTKNTTTNVVTDKRDILGNPTYFNSYYYNSGEKQYAYTYHVVTFTDQVFDGEGKPYKAGDTVGGSSTWQDGDEKMLMSGKTTDRAVVDGIFITGGNADAQVSNVASSNANINQYGGAALVTDYAHVRNCVLRGNSATYGGALALTHNALVSGCLIDQNTADYGGAIYMFENGTVLSDGTKIDTTPNGTAVDGRMAHVYTSTIVNNTANNQGGGIWFGQNEDDINIRVNSSVIWQNSSATQANVSGLYNPTKAAGNTQTTQEFFPFSYCAVQNLRLSGVNNLQLGNLNTAGSRFASASATSQNPNTLAKETTASDFTKYDDFGYYALTDYSILVRTGMPASEYSALMANAGLSASDFTSVSRLVATDKNRTYIEMGARAYDKIHRDGQLMLRLFVAQPDQIDMDAAQTMMALADGAKSGSDEEYYSQEGSSFAYPMQSLQDALDYIVEKRSLNDKKDGLNCAGANNLPFEICIGKGTFYPSKNLSGIYGVSPSNSFAIPEGVSIYGSFAIGNPDKENSFFGRYYKENSSPESYGNTPSENVTAVTSDLVSLKGGNYTIDQLPIEEMKPRRRTNDTNGNNIIEPWEFRYQTILSGDVEGSTSSGVYHVVCVPADQNIVGMLPKASITHDKAYNYDSMIYGDYTDHYGAGSYDYEVGQEVVLDGLQITGGHALNYIEGSTGEMSKYNYYCGGGALVDGNRYCDAYNKYPDYYAYADAAAYNAAKGTSLTEDEFKALGTATYKHQGISGAVGYRDIPFTISQCRFIDNEAGLGGAVCTNGNTTVYSSTFEQNRAVSGSETVPGSDGTSQTTVTYAGIGGAVMATHQFTAYNTLFANNEAYDQNLSYEPVKFPNYNMQDTDLSWLLGGTGGVAYIGPYGFFHFINCNLVRNRANMFPAVFTKNPNRDFTAGRNDGIGSSNKWRPTYNYCNQFINTVFWGNDINDEMSGKYDSNSIFKFNSRLICNYAPGEYDTYTVPDFDKGVNTPASQDALDGNSNAQKSDFGETAWFCAYEANRGVTPLNDLDIRNAKTSPLGYIRDAIHDGSVEQSKSSYQNCNILLSSENFDLEGPNFINPSSTPGYAGYNESADWSPARISNLVDNGSGKIAQSITLQSDGTYSATFKTYKDGAGIPERSVNYNGGNADGYTTETADDYEVEGAYTIARVLYGYEHNRGNMPLGETEYMISASTNQQLYRISYDPNPTHDQTYVDIGVYEYPHTELQYTTSGDEVDILWVSPVEKPDNGLPDGSDWSQPTSDLQRAIETLLASRNGHRKEIRMMDGTFTPIYNINDKLAFCIDTKSLNQAVTMPAKSYEADGKTVKEYDTGKGVVSLTIKGGYSREQKDAYNPDRYPAIIRQQSRSNDNSDRWDNLFYVCDGTQRYGYDEKVGYTSENGYGNYAPDGDTFKKTVNTIPLHIDGVQLVNNQALPGVNGAAIHYADLDDNVTAPTEAHVSVNTYYTDAENRDDASKSADNTPTRYFERTVDKYYTDATFTTVSDVETPYATYKYDATTANKIIISKTKVMNSGSYKAGDYTTSAVYIGKNGGNALLYNDVMHSNQGNPLVSAVNTTIVNNTYALNKGRVDLNGENTRVSTLDINQDSNSDNYDPDGPMLAPHRPRRSAYVPDGSSIFNSVFWRNNDNSTQFVLPGFISAAKSGSIFSHNAVTGFSTDIIDYSLPAMSAQNNNVGLSDTNNDVINGPNFTDPKLDAVSNADIEARDFTLQPSLRLLNKGSESFYRDKVDSYTQNYNIYDLAWLTSTRTDAGGNARFCYTIDLGAYEYQNNLNRIIYVNPNVNMTGLGNSWADPVGYGYLQAAIDLAAVYHVNNVEDEAYVFVKGAGSSSTGLHLGETLTMRDGVSVYGSILPTRTEDCPYTVTGDADSQARTYSQTDIDAYIATVTAERGGLASPSANKTTVSGIKVPSATTFNDTNADIVSLIDGFDVTAANSQNPSGTVTGPVIDIRPYNAEGRVAVRNVIVHDNDLSATEFADLAQVNNALIYEALFRDNKVSASGAQLKLGANGYGVNLTVEGTTVGADNTTQYNGTDSHTKDHIFNSLVNYAGHAATEHTLSGYNYKVADSNLNYQLTEKSAHIDQCDATNPMESVATLKQFINYSTDRDLLGNLRLLSGVSSADKIDRGAFETWRVDQDVQCTSKDTSGNLTNYYPHNGSVVYVMQGNSLVMEDYATQTTGGVTTQTSGTPFTPAYLLLQDGASLYGGGNAVNVGYLGVERQVSGNGSMVSLPYDMHYTGTDIATNGTGTPAYNTDGVLTLTADNAETFSYSGLDRSAWNAKFYDTNSDNWIPLPDVETMANSGVLYRPAADKLCRFTAQGDADDMSKYVYTETAGDISKIVTLVQYDDRTSTDGGADFTEKEDMGWNCIGLPYLVSNYSTADKETLSGDGNYNMNVPHTLWLWYDGKTYPDGTTPVDGDGGFYSVSSWDTSDWHLATGDEARIWVGEGIFTQTSAVAGTEQLAFHRPVYATSSPSKGAAIDDEEAAQPRRVNVRYYADTRDIDEPQAELTIRVRGHVVYVYGLQGGENIIVYDTAGRVYNMAKASTDTYSTAVPANGVYVIRVDDKAQKVVVK